MKPRLKSLDEQVIIITGASSGIGLVTARMAVTKGARLVLSARNEEALRKIVDQINASGGQAIYVVADVGQEQDVRRIADAAVQRFGGFDTWVNNAGVSIYGKLEEVPLDEQRRLFDTNYWGVVNGSLVAAQHLKQRGGAIINVGSTLSDRAIPIQGAYCASKHAVKAFTDSLRMELEADGLPISVTLIKPGGIDTPYTRHAKNYLPSEPQNPSPLYAPETVADAILHAAQHRVRDILVGGSAKMLSVAGKYAPRLLDRLMERTTIQMQQSNQPPRSREDNSLYKPSRGLEERSGAERHVAERSIYTKASLHPVLTGAALLAAAGLGVAALWRAATGPRSGWTEPETWMEPERWTEVV